MIAKNRLKKFPIGLAGRIGKSVVLLEVKALADNSEQAEAVAIRITRKVFPKFTWEAIAL